jgi:hypothetical protein
VRANRRAGAAFDAFSRVDNNLVFSGNRLHRTNLGATGTFTALATTTGAFSVFPATLTIIYFDAHKILLLIIISNYYNMPLKFCKKNRNVIIPVNFRY